MKKIVLGVSSLAALTVLTACNARQAPLNRAVNPALNAQRAATQFGRFSAGAEAEGHSRAFARKLANPDTYKFAFEAGASSVCGATDDLQDVEDYDGKGGPSKALAAKASPSVGALAMGPAGPNSRKFCSGTLISENLFLTASHCVDGNITKNFAVFNYQTVAGSNGKTLREQTHVAIKGIVEDGGYRQGGLDYAILELEGTPGKTFGFKKLNASVLKPKDVVFDVQHPRGWPKKVHGGFVDGTRGTKYVTYVEMDTHPGSSGSGVLNGKGELVAVHTNGGCRSTGGANAGVPLSNIVKNSKVLKALMN